MPTDNIFLLNSLPDTQLPDNQDYHVHHTDPTGAELVKGLDDLPAQPTTNILS